MSAQEVKLHATLQERKIKSYCRHPEVASGVLIKNFKHFCLRKKNKLKILSVEKLSKLSLPSTIKIHYNTVKDTFNKHLESAGDV